MRICRKCSAQFSDQSKICRSCGAILDDVPESVVHDTGLTADDDAPAHTVSVSASRERGRDSVAGQWTGGPAGNPAETTPGDDDLPEWSCPACGEAVPGNFRICWKCRADRPDAAAQSGVTPLGNGACSLGAPDVQAKPHDRTHGHSAREMEVRRPLRTECPQCGSTKMMVGVTVCDEGQGAKGSLRVVVCANPAALIFKDRLYGELKADLCGDCGHAELRVVNPQALYKHYRAARL